MELIQAILAKGKEVVEPLSRILQDKQYWEAEGDKLWMPTHAVKLLGVLADPEAIPPSPGPAAGGASPAPTHPRFSNRGISTATAVSGASSTGEYG